MRVPLWNVEVSVEGFGPNHALWKRFTRYAEALADPVLEWRFPQATEVGGGSSRLGAAISADSPEAAIL